MRFELRLLFFSFSVLRGLRGRARRPSNERSVYIGAYGAMSKKTKGGSVCGHVVSGLLFVLLPLCVIRLVHVGFIYYVCFEEGMYAYMWHKYVLGNNPRPSEPNERCVPKQSIMQLATRRRPRPSPHGAENRPRPFFRRISKLGRINQAGVKGAPRAIRIANRALTQMVSAARVRLPKGLLRVSGGEEEEDDKGRRAGPSGGRRFERILRRT